MKKDVEIKQKEKSMNYSIKEGSASSVMFGVTDSYTSPLAIALNANNAQIGLLSSIPNLLSPLSQIIGSRLMEKYTRKKILINFVTLQAIFILPIVFLSLFFWKSLFLNLLPYLLVLFYSLYAVSGAIAGPSWFSIMGDIVPEKIRGKYFGKRNRITGVVAIISALSIAFFLDFFKTHGLILAGFSIIFIIASIARFISAHLFRKHYEPKLKFEKGDYFSFWQFIRKAPGNNFGKFVFFIAAMQFAVNIATPFFAVYMLRDLGFSYTTFILVNISASVFTIIFMPVWGKFSDKYGNRELLKIGSMIVPMLPALWLVSQTPVYLILVPQLLSGIGWSAFNLAVSNFIYDSVTRERRGICVAYHNIISGICIFVGATLGGLLAQYLSINFMNKLLFIFLISTIARALVVIIMLHKIKEVRAVEKPKPNPISYIKEINPRGMIFDMVHDAKSVGRIFRRKVF